MGTDPKRPQDPDAMRRPSGAESKHGPPADSGGQRSRAGSDYGDWVPDPGRPHPRLDDDSGGGDLMDVPPERGSPQSERGRAGTTRTGVAGEQERLDDEAEARAESNRNKDFDTTHVHSSTTSRKV
jgi:hypothetical protein